MPLVVPLKVYSHFAVVEYMQKTLSLTTQRQAVLSFFHNCRLALCGSVSCAALRANIEKLDGKAWNAFVHTAVSCRDSVTEHLSQFLEVLHLQ